MVNCIDNVDDGVAVTVVFQPCGADTTLAAKIPELEYCRGQHDLPDCARRTYIQLGCVLTFENVGLSGCAGSQDERFPTFIFEVVGPSGSKRGVVRLYKVRLEYDSTS